MRKFMESLPLVGGLFTGAGFVMNFYDLWNKICCTEIIKRAHEFFSQYLVPLGVPESSINYILISSPFVFFLLLWIVYRLFMKLVDAIHTKKGSCLGEEWPIQKETGEPVFRMRWIPGGTFEMGLLSKNTPEEKQIAPLHSVTLTDGFWVCENLVTQRQYYYIMLQNPSKNRSHDNYPVENLTWKEAMRFCAKFKKKVLDPLGWTGMEVRLLTEAEWEYASRAGHSKESYEVLPDMAFYQENSNGKTQSINKKQPNDFGLYDTHGNVREFVLDHFGKLLPKKAKNPRGPRSGRFHVVRGGSFRSTLYECLSGYRDRLEVGKRSDDVGFRFAIVVKK